MNAPDPESIKISAINYLRNVGGHLAADIFSRSKLEIKTVQLNYFWQKSSLEQRTLFNERTCQRMLKIKKVLAANRSGGLLTGLTMMESVSRNYESSISRHIKMLGNSAI